MQSPCFGHGRGWPFGTATRCERWLMSLCSLRWRLYLRSFAKDRRGTEQCRAIVALACSTNLLQERGVTTLLKLILQCLQSTGTACCYDFATLIPLHICCSCGITFWILLNHWNFTIGAVCQSLPCDSAGLLGTQFARRFR